MKYAFYDAKIGMIDIVPKGQSYREVGKDNIHAAARAMLEMKAAGMISHGLIRDDYGNYWNESLTLESASPLN